MTEEEYKKEIERLNDEIDELEEKVINAINYLKHNSYSNNSYETFTSPNPIKDLLEILGDKENDRRKSRKF